MDVSSRCARPFVMREQWWNGLSGGTIIALRALAASREKQGGKMSVTRIGHVGLVVTDLEAYAEYLTSGLGMVETRREADRAYFALGTRHHQVRVTEGDANVCDGLGFDVSDSESLRRLRTAVDEAGLEVVSDQPYDDAAAEGFSFNIPQGPTVELCVGSALAPPTAEHSLDHYPRTRGPSSTAETGSCHDRQPGSGWGRASLRRCPRLPHLRPFPRCPRLGAV